MSKVTRGRAPVRLVAVGIIAAGALLAATLPGSAGNAGLSGSSFESTDGNLVVDNTGHGGGDPTHSDWASIPNTGAPNEVRKNDLESGQGDNSFTQGADEQTAVPAVATGGIPPSKSDLKTFGVYVEPDSPGFLHMFWTRVQEPQGTTNMDFEFNQKKCIDGVGDCTSNETTPIRTPGDVLITYNLSSGGANVSLWLHKWVTSGTCEGSQEGSGSSKSATETAPCWDVGVDLTQSGNATGSINNTAISAANADDLGSLSARTFGEASVNLQSIFGSSCFALGGAYLKSRSSDTFTSALKDFIAPAAINVSNCGSINVVKKDDANNTLAGAKFKLYRDDGDGVEGTASTFEPTGDDVQIKADGTTGSFECQTSSSDGTGNCSWSNLTFGKYWVHETVVPDGYTQSTPNPRLINVTNTTTVTVTFTNPRKHNIVVLVCHEGTNTLVSSDVTIGGTTKASLAPGSLTSAQQAALCGLGGANFGGFGHGSQTATVDVGKVGGTTHS